MSTTTSSRVVRTLFCLSAAIVLAGVSSQPAFAQGARAEVGAGYAYLIDQDLNLPAGVFVDIGVPVSDSLSVVGELGLSRGSDDSFEVPVDFTVTTFQGGVRVSGRASSVVVFGQMLGGLARLGANASAGGVDVGLTLNAVSVQFGGGVIVPISPRVGVRAGGDYRAVVPTEEDLGTSRQFRISAGLSVGLGQ